MSQIDQIMCLAPLILLFVVLLFSVIFSQKNERPNGIITSGICLGCKRESDELIRGYCMSCCDNLAKPKQEEG